MLTSISMVEAQQGWVQINDTTPDAVCIHTTSHLNCNYSFRFVHCSAFCTLVQLILQCSASCTTTQLNPSCSSMLQRTYSFSRTDTLYCRSNHLSRSTLFHSLQSATSLQMFCLPALTWAIDLKRY